MIQELFPFLLGLALSGMWAVGERSLRKTTEESRTRLIKDVEYWRSYTLTMLNQDRLDRKRTAKLKKK